MSYLLYVMHIYTRTLLLTVFHCCIYFDTEIQYMPKITNTNSANSFHHHVAAGDAPKEAGEGYLVSVWCGGGNTMMPVSRGSYKALHILPERSHVWPSREHATSERQPKDLPVFRSRGWCAPGCRTPPIPSEPSASSRGTPSRGGYGSLTPPGPEQWSLPSLSSKQDRQTGNS